jgi:hypothetical protein
MPGVHTLISDVLQAVHRTACDAMDAGAYCSRPLVVLMCNVIDIYSNLLLV